MFGNRVTRERGNDRTRKMPRLRVDGSGKTRERESREGEAREALGGDRRYFKRPESSEGFLSRLLFPVRAWSRFSVHSPHKIPCFFFFPWDFASGPTHQDKLEQEPDAVVEHTIALSNRGMSVKLGAPGLRDLDSTKHAMSIMQRSRQRSHCVPASHLR
ncbi:hypothetical protein VUR80DRAFT_6929 [Thermomyces stellatus]